jgi:hypothetical protein
MKFLFSLCLVLLSFSASANNHRPDDHAPIGVMRDHVHKKGELMTSYRISYMKMKGLRIGDDRTNPASVFQNNSYMAIPTQMTMKMHMLGAMYGITDNLTIAAMGSFIQKDMDHLKKMGGSFSRDVEDFGDSKVSLLYQFLNNNLGKAQFNAGISLPTGSINEKSPDRSRMPYPMQIGSGSYEFLPGFSYLKQYEKFSLGAQINANFKLNQNKYDYKLGDSYNATIWTAHKINNAFSISARLDYNKNEAIEGKDSQLNPAMISTADSSLQDGERLDLLLGVNFLTFAYNRLALEFGRPIYQRIDGPMLETDYKITVGWQKVF